MGWIQRWQYQVKAEPVLSEAPVPDFGWFQQQPDQVFSRKSRPEGWFATGAVPEAFDPHILSSETTVIFGGKTVLYQGLSVPPPQPPIVPQLPVAETVVIVGGQLFQYQGLAFVDFSAPTVLDTDWIVAQPDVVRPRPQINEGWFTRGYDDSEAIPDFGWYQQHPEPLPALTAPEGYFALVEFAIPVAFDLDWFVQASEPVREPPKLVPEGKFAFGADPIIPSFDWFQFPADVIHPLHQVQTGLFVSGREEELIEVDLDWFIQEPEPLPKLRRLEGLTALVESLPVVPFDLDWYVQEPEPLPLPTRPEGAFVRGYDDSELTPSFDWFKQQPEPLPLPTRPEGQFALVEFVAPVPDFDWFIQQPEPLPRPVRPEGSIVLGQPPITPEIPNSHTTLRIEGERRLYQTRAEPLEPVAEVPDFVSPSQPDIVRQLRIESGWFTRGFDDSEAIPDFGWFQQHPEPLPEPTRPEGQFTLVEFGVPVAFDTDWIVQHPDPVIAPRRPEGFYTRGYDDSEAIPDFGWSQQQPEPLPLPIRPEGYFSLVEFGVPVVFDIDWLRQYPEPLPAPRRPEGWYTRGYDDSEITPDFSWFQQHPEPLPSPSRLEGHFSLVEALPVVPQDFDWWVQEPGPQLPPTRPDGYYTRPEVVEEVPDFGWFKQPPQPLPEFVRPEGYYVLVEFAPTVPVDFDWFVQEPDPVRLPERRLEGQFVWPTEIIIPDFDWFHQQADVVRRPTRPEGLFTWHPETPAPPVVPDFGWLQQYPEPLPRPVRPRGAIELAIVIIPEVTVPIFEVRICLVLWEFFINDLLPDPSGFISDVIIDVPSGFMEEIIEDTPSGWTKDETQTTLWDLTS